MYAATPAWVKWLAVVGLIVVVVVVVALLSGGKHGPGRHLGSQGADPAVSATSADRLAG